MNDLAAAARHGAARLGGRDLRAQGEELRLDGTCGAGGEAGAGAADGAGLARQRARLAPRDGAGFTQVAYVAPYVACLGGRTRASGPRAVGRDFRHARVAIIVAAGNLRGGGRGGGEGEDQDCETAHRWASSGAGAAKGAAFFTQAERSPNGGSALELPACPQQRVDEP